MDKYFLGVDGGNSKTLALIASSDGHIVGAGRGAGSDIYLGEHPAVREVARAMDEALAAAGLEREQISTAVFSLSGVNWAQDAAFWQETLRARMPAQRIVVVNDALGALRAGSPDSTGVAVVCGTGTGTAARNAQGEAWYSGAWQRVQGAYDLGQRALRAIVEAELGVAPPTSLTQNALQLFAQSSVEGLLYTLTRRRRTGVLLVTRLTVSLVQEAEKGDVVAQDILRQHGTDLGAYAVYAARRTSLASTEFNLVLTGSVLGASALLREALVSRVRRECGCTVHASDVKPVIGALLLALDTDDSASEHARRQHISHSMPPAHLFRP